MLVRGDIWQLQYNSAYLGVCCTALYFDDAPTRYIVSCLNRLCFSIWKVRFPCSRESLCLNTYSNSRCHWGKFKNFINVNRFWVQFSITNFFFVSNSTAKTLKNAWRLTTTRLALVCSTVAANDNCGALVSSFLLTSRYTLAFSRGQIKSWLRLCYLPDLWNHPDRYLN